MAGGIERWRRALRSAVLHGQTTWSVDELTAADRRFEEVWAVTRLIPGWFEEVNAAALFLILAGLRPERIVEIGSYLGRSTVFFAKSLEVLGLDGRVTAIDPHTGDRQHLEALGAREIPSYDLFCNHLEVAGVAGRVEAVVAPSHQAADGWSAPVDFLFIDGWHSYDAVMEDAGDWLPHLTAGGVVVFDDAVRYPDVRRAISDLAARGAFHLWGDAFGQAYGGRSPAVPPAVATVLHSYRPLTRHLPGHRTVRPAR